jgi:hypothetical protein
MALSFLKLESSFSVLFQLEYFGDWDFDGAPWIIEIKMSSHVKSPSLEISISMERSLQSRTAVAVSFCCSQFLLQSCCSREQLLWCQLLLQSCCSREQLLLQRHAAVANSCCSREQLPRGTLYDDETQTDRGPPRTAIAASLRYVLI